MKRGAESSSLDGFLLQAADSKNPFKAKQLMSEALGRLNARHTNLVTAVSTEDLQDFAFGKNGAENPNTRALFDEPMKISSMVSDQIISATSKNELIKRYEFYAKLLDECIKSNNLLAAKAICTGLMASPVSRIMEGSGNQSFERVRAISSDGLFSNMSMHKNLRAVQNDKNSVVIPTPELIQADFARIDEGNENRNDRKQLKDEQIAQFQDIQNRLRQAPVNHAAASADLSINRINLNADVSYERSAEIYKQGKFDFKGKDSPEALIAKNEDNILERCIQADGGVQRVISGIQKAKETDKGWDGIDGDIGNKIAELQGLINETTQVSKYSKDSVKKQVAGDAVVQLKEMVTQLREGRVFVKEKKAEYFQKQEAAEQAKQNAAAPPPVAAQAAPVPHPVAAPSHDKGKEEEKAAAPVLLEPIEQAATPAPQAHSKYKVGGKVDAKGRKRYEEDGENTPESSQQKAAANIPPSAIAAYNQLKSEAVDAIAQHKNHESSRDYPGRPDSPKRPIYDDRWARQNEIYLNRINELGAKIEGMEKQFPGLNPKIVAQAAPAPVQPVATSSSSSEKGKEEEKAPVAEMEPVEKAAPPAKHVAVSRKEAQAQPIPYSSAGPKQKDMNISKADPKILAQELKQKHLMMINNITNEELYAARWDKPDAKSSCPNILAIMKDYNKITQQVKEDILFSKTPGEQKKTFVAYAKLMKEASAIGDYHTANAIFVSLYASPAVSRLHANLQTAETQRILDDHNELFSTSDNNINLRTAMQEKGKKTSVVPLTSLTLQKLLTADGIQIPDDPKERERVLENVDARKNAAVQGFGVYQNQPLAKVNKSSRMGDWPDTQFKEPSDQQLYDVSMAIKARGDKAKYFGNPQAVADSVSKLKAELSANPEPENIQQAVAAPIAVAPVAAVQQPAAPQLASENDRLREIAAQHAAAELKGKDHAPDPEKPKQSKPPLRRTIKLTKEQREYIAANRPKGPAPIPPSESTKPPEGPELNGAPNVPERVKEQSKAWKAQQQQPQQPAAQQMAAENPVVNTKAQLKSILEVAFPKRTPKIAGGNENAGFPMVSSSSIEAVKRVLDAAGIQYSTQDYKAKTNKGERNATMFRINQDAIAHLSPEALTKIGSDINQARKEIDAQRKDEKKQEAAIANAEHYAPPLPKLPNEQAPPLPPPLSPRTQDRILNSTAAQLDSEAKTSKGSKAEEAQQIAASLREKAPLPALPVVKVDPPANTTPPPVATSPVDAAAQLANMLNNPMPSSNITAPPLETTAPQPQGFGKPRRRAELGQAAALGNDEVKADAKPPMVSNFDTVKNFWKARDSKAIQAAKEEKGATADAGRKPIKPN